MMDTITHKRLAEGPPARTYLDGSEYWIVQLPSVRFGLGHFKPGWIWATHAGAQTGKDAAAHIGYIQSGAMAVEGAVGSKVVLGPGDAFELGPGHNAWVVGDELCIALDMTVK